ncbi:VOC family protein [Halobaculum gomorrense]|uniref:Glyoxalase/Bleomycin resistance protein/Dioxygenase superfamily protein n=1 Tax=Halobaculum gomorrense TaxID=43928 RepID=A0A1M5K153_9EURY|nr:VOC family protein [Halobaculum gomorrense]SHG46582.1 Glyoxalase/Bleomycin resistance protein/Dioxygenase superfamily protein [Halobaculum gomorrense]
MTEPDDRARALGINHVALEVGDIDAAVEWWRSLFAVELRGTAPGMAFLDMGDQFVALSETAEGDGAPDHHRHFGLVVDDLDAVEDRLDEVDGERLDTGGFDVRDPWGNRIQLVEYRAVQFTKAPYVLDGMGIDGEARAKTAEALAELAEKDMDSE